MAILLTIEVQATEVRPLGVWYTFYVFLREEEGGTRYWTERKKEAKH